MLDASRFQKFLGETPPPLVQSVCVQVPICVPHFYGVYTCIKGGLKDEGEDGTFDFKRHVLHGRSFKLIQIKSVLMEGHMLRHQQFYGASFSRHNRTENPMARAGLSLQRSWRRRK